MATGNKRVFVVGVGMTKFEKPGRREDFDYPQMALEAGNNAFKDAGISYDKVEQACVGYCFGDSTCGQRAVYQFGLTGIPVYNLSNACATGSTALMLGRQLIEGGLAECVLTLGFEKMDRGPIKLKFSDRASGMDKHMEIMSELRDITAAPINAQYFGNAGREHMEKYGTKPEHFAKIAYKNHKHSTNNPNSQFQKYYSLEEIMKSPMIYEPLTLLQCCPTSDGGGAAILASEEFVRRNGLEAKAVEIVAQAMSTDLPATFTDKSCLNLIGYGMTKNAAEKVYNKAGIRPDDIDVIELHDCFSANELITYEALGLCDPGKAGEFIDRGDNTYGGKYVINPSGGLISKGHPLGATGLAQCTELSWQLRGLAGKRQVPGAKLALQHNVGLGGAVVVTLYRMGFPEATQSVGRILPNQTAALKKTDLKSSMAFAAIAQELERNGEAYVKPIKGSFCVKVTKGNDVGSWLINLKEGKGSVEFNSDKKGDVTVTLSDEDFIKMGSGQINPQQAFFQGKLKISGNMMLLMKVRNLQGQVEKDFGVKAKL